MSAAVIADLDQHPELHKPVLALFRAHESGRAHAVNGVPVRMAQRVEATDLAACLGIIALLDGQRVAGALALCPYSEDQVTLWGPVVADGYDAPQVARRLFTEIRGAVREGGYSSVRALADTRNRPLRATLLGLGLTVWKDSHVFERNLSRVTAVPDGVRPMARRDHAVVAAILAGAFPDSGHCQPDLATREKEGYQHYVAEEDGLVVAAAAVQVSARRSWLKLIAVRPDLRRRGTGRRLLDGLLTLEAGRHQEELGLEVLADNPAANAAFAAAGFRRAWSFTILTGPV